MLLVKLKKHHAMHARAAVMDRVGAAVISWIAIYCHDGQLAPPVGVMCHLMYLP